MRTEDHPLDYADFEGVIPKGEYGGGTVIVWDRGTWEPEGDARKGLERGRLTFDLHGEKLRGRWHLVRTRLDGGKRENWLLFKSRDAEADDGARRRRRGAGERGQRAYHRGGGGRAEARVALRPEGEGEGRAPRARPIRSSW